MFRNKKRSFCRAYPRRSADNRAFFIDPKNRLVEWGSRGKFRVVALQIGFSVNIGKQEQPLVPLHPLGHKLSSRVDPRGPSDNIVFFM